MATFTLSELEHPIPFYGIYEEKDGSLTMYSSGADVQKVWKAYGWIPPSTVRNDYLFKENRIASGLNKLD
jgi:hypothetical protein